MPKLVCAAIFALSVAAGGLLTARARAREAARFERQADMFAQAVAARADHYIDAVRACAGLFLASQRVTPEEFRRFVASLDVAGRYPGILGLGFARVTSRRPMRTSIEYLEPRRGDNLKALGYDMFSEPVRRRAMESAASGGAAATDAVVLVQDEGTRRPGFLIYYPVFRDGELEGFAYAPFRAGEFFSAVRTPPGLEFSVSDSSGRLLHARGAPESARLSAARPVTLAGREWRLVEGTDGGLSVYERWEGALIAFLGLALGLVFYRVLSDSERRSAELRAAVAALRRMEGELERRVADRTRELESANKELESFAYSVSHDLRAPLRTIEGFSAVLVRRLGEKLSGEDAAHFKRIRSGVERMGAIIDDVLKLSRVARAEVNRAEVDVTALARGVAAEAARHFPHAVSLTVEEGLTAVADPALLRLTLDNLIGNAYKYTSKTPGARVEVGREGGAFFVRDNGAGFDMAHVDKLFQPFTRLHTREEFEGTGVGLAIVRRIVERHGGRAWAEGAVGRGATVRFTLGAPA